MADSFVKEEGGREWVDCAFDGCRSRAVISKVVMGQNGRANFCLEHYHDHNLEQALKWNHANGLDTEEKRKEYVFKHQFRLKQMP